MIKTEFAQPNPPKVAFGDLEVGTFFLDETFRVGLVFVKLEGDDPVNGNGSALTEEGLDFGYSWMPNELVSPIRGARFIVEEY